MAGEHRDKPHWAERTVRWLSHNWFQIGSPLGGVLIAIASVPDLVLPDAEKSKTAIIGPWGWQQYMLAVGVAFVIASLIGQLATRPTYSELFEDRDRAKKLADERANIMESVLASVLVHVCKQAGLGGFDHRASLYCHNSASFVLLVRTSDNPDLGKTGRISYPEHEGVIGKAWSGGKAVLVDLPEDRVAWEDQMVEQGLTPDTAKTLRMQSRSIIAVRIDDESRFPSEPIGLMVLESLAARGVNGRTLDRVAESGAWPILTTLMINARAHFPALARELVAGASELKRGSWRRHASRH